MFERFTDKARQVLVVAQVESIGLGHNYIGTEHLLLGLLEGEGVAANVLRSQGIEAEAVRQAIVARIGPAHQPTVADADALASIGIDLDQVKAAVEESFGEGALERSRLGGRSARRKRPRAFGAPAFVPRAKKVIELSLREALSLGHNYVGTEHLLLAILREGQGVAAAILAERIDPIELRTSVLDELKRYRPGA